MKMTPPNSFVVPKAPPASRFILDVRVDATSYNDATLRIVSWATTGESRYVCASSVNNLVRALDDASFRSVMNGADLVTPDGMPLVWALRLLGCADATRVYGPCLTEHICVAAEAMDVPVGFLGGTPTVLADLQTEVGRRWPRLHVAFAHSPPFRAASKSELDTTIAAIRDSGVRILFVGLGTPKQDCWMAEHCGKFPAVMIGVGAAFDFLSGAKAQAPWFMQRSGLEWIFRLASEPRRLWRRYLLGNPRFVWAFARQLLRERWGRGPARSKDKREM